MISGGRKEAECAAKDMILSAGGIHGFLQGLALLQQGGVRQVDTVKISETQNGRGNGSTHGANAIAAEV